MEFQLAEAYARYRYADLTHNEMETLITGLSTRGLFHEFAGLLAQARLLDNQRMHAEIAKGQVIYLITRTNNEFVDRFKSMGLPRVKTYGMMHPNFHRASVKNILQAQPSLSVLVLTADAITDRASHEILEAAAGRNLDSFILGRS